MFCNVFTQLIRNVFTHLILDDVSITLEHKLLQNREILDSRERLHLGEGPYNFLELRSCIGMEFDAGDRATLDDKKFKLWEHM